MLAVLSLVTIIRIGFDTKCIVITPPKPVREFIYKCDSVCHYQSLIPLYANCDSYGLVWITGNEYKICCLESDGNLFVLNKNKVHLAKGHKKGGQSANRISRLHDESHFNYTTKVLEAMDQTYINNSNYWIKGLIIAGTNIKRKELINRLNRVQKNILIGQITTDQDYNSTLFVSKGLELINKYYSQKEEKLINEYFDIKNEDLLIYGPKHINRALNDHSLKSLLIYEPIITERKMKIENIKKICKNGGCELHITNYYHQRLVDYGGILGLNWY